MNLYPLVRKPFQNRRSEPARRFQSRAVQPGLQAAIKIDNDCQAINFHLFRDFWLPQSGS
jgi:hypothetical protein